MITNVGYDHHVTGTGRPKTGFGITSVGRPINSATITAATAAAAQRRDDQPARLPQDDVERVGGSWRSTTPTP